VTRPAGQRDPGRHHRPGERHRQRRRARPGGQAGGWFLVGDAGCTESADLAGIYFAVQASYEQQLVNASQQALAAAVRRYRAAYQKGLGQLLALLRTAKATPAR
jgi:hypothetical protein